ncbi:MAG: helix-turn-helix domain-containing protein [Methanomassiliicoccus sp.]|nr:helix-turn-helix domain-containing protein [Methanomassiliicoccus sp.]
MRYDDKLISNLRMLGLTDYGARAYLALITYGPLGASAVAEASTVPRSKVYDVLRRLVREEWVTTTGTRPMRYAACDPRKVMGSRRERMIDELDSTAAELRTRYDGVVEKEPPNAWMVRGSQNIAARVREILGRAREEVLLLGALYMREELEVMVQVAPELRRKGVRVRVMTRSTIATADGGLDLVKELRPLTEEVRIIRTPMIKFIVADGRDIMIMFSPVVGEVPDVASSLAIWMPRSEVAAQMKDNFYMMWDGAVSEL